ncbi:WGR domain-containing protein [Kitasatospora sp. MBT63]|uniref:WGR domain-containing protein n=1 Tax=Kitasatospora sp. MBT63 TaxID=1444768 RepID=UPI000B24085B|nr:WGR domain-containing protein [Kitasatospora sp. MBT63]
MRRWEFVEGGSDKFWEAAVDGAVVTVRYGRCGTDGREQSKEFPTPEAAQVHFARTVAEKERKGYRETGADAAPVPQPATTPEPTDAPVDEDTFVLPDAWRRALIPRRGGAIRPPAAPAKNTVNGYHDTLRQMDAWLEQALTADRSDADLVAAARAHQRGSQNPLGAAVLAALFSSPAENSVRRAVDAWVAEFGLPFAARATVELFTVAVETDWHTSRTVNPVSGVGSIPGLRCTVPPRTGSGRCWQGATRRPIARRSGPWPDAGPAWPAWWCRRTSCRPSWLGLRSARGRVRGWARPSGRCCCARSPLSNR